MRDTSATLQLLAGLLGLCAYIPLTIGIVRETTRQSFAAFLLWGFLDSIAMVSAILQKGNYWLAASNVAGTFCIATLLLIKKQFEWSVTETVTSLLVVVCLCIWYSAGNTVAIVASSLAVVIAGIPQMAHTMRHPQHTPVPVYLLWVVANAVSLVAGRDWSIEERFYACCALALCVAIVGIAGIRTKD